MYKNNDLLGTNQQSKISLKTMKLIFGSEASEQISLRLLSKTIVESFWKKIFYLQ